MGWFDKRRERKAAEERARAQEAAEGARQAWDDWTDELLFCLELARSGGLVDDGTGIVTMLLKKNEKVFMFGDGASLVEARRLPGEWVGRSQGVSLRVMKGVSYRIGGNRGTFQQGAEVPTVIDTGRLTISNQRIVFQGNKQTREWGFSKLIGYQHDPDLPITYFQVSNRQKTSGLLYDDKSAATFRLRLAVALAWADGDASEIIPVLEEKMRSHQAAIPPAGAQTDSEEEPERP
jgi:hypothetical protein